VEKHVMSIETQVVFLTQKWRARAAAFEAALSDLANRLSLAEPVWISVGERQNEPWLFATIKWSRDVPTSSRWSKTTDATSGMVYERAYEGPDPSPASLVSDIEAILSEGSD
jgi:hypothetical protein